MRLVPVHHAIIAAGALIAAYPASAAVASQPSAGPAAAEVLTTEEAAELLRVDTQTVAEMAGAGTLPARRLGLEWRFSRAALLDWLRGSTGSQTSAVTVPSPPADGARLSAVDSRQLVGRGLAGSAGATAAQQAGPEPSDDGTIGRPPSGRTASEVFLRDQRILLAPNELTVDIGLFYARGDELALVDPTTGPFLANVESDSSGAILLTRYSIGPDTELFARASYSSQKVTGFDGSATLGSRSNNEFGAIGFGVRRTLIHEGPGRPDIILTIEGSVPTEGGSYSAGGGLTFVKSFDPAVLFGSVAYRRALRREFDAFDRLQPRDRFETTAGYAFALNDTLTLNTALTGIFSSETEFGDTRLRRSETFNLLFGMTARVARSLYLQPSVGFRLNGPGNAMVLALNIPYTFSR